MVWVLTSVYVYFVLSGCIGSESYKGRNVSQKIELGNSVRVFLVVHTKSVHNVLAGNEPVHSPNLLQTDTHHMRRQPWFASYDCVAWVQ